jgi:hypothetical protein
MMFVGMLGKIELSAGMAVGCGRAVIGGSAVGIVGMPGMVGTACGAASDFAPASLWTATCVATGVGAGIGVAGGAATWVGVGVGAAVTAVGATVGGGGGASSVLLHPSAPSCGSTDKATATTARFGFSMSRSLALRRPLEKELAEDPNLGGSEHAKHG